jgi:hypothetical protein|tara:strand:- start:393 stop:611 length:219 start_codon:yes stop_codon:yes gene_type:complete
MKLKIKDEFDSKSTKLGTFIILLITLGLGFIVTMLVAGVNPTLVISIVSAPMWVCIIILALKLTKYLRGKNG